jgi:hypothetical protein
MTPNWGESTMSIKRLVLMTAFRLSMIWDLISTFLGMLLILGAIGFIPFGISVVGTLIVGAFNFATQSIWARSHDDRKAGFFMQFLLLRVTWFLAIAFDFWTSLTCNALYVASPHFNILQDIGQVRIQLTTLMSALTFGQIIIVLFVTTMATISPMMVGYIRDWDAEFLT